MTLTATPFSMDGTTDDGQLIREAVGSLVAPNGGTVNYGDFFVAQQTVPNMSVAIAPGRAWIPGTSLPFVTPGSLVPYWPQGPYFVESDASVTFPISAANPSNPRVDTLILQVRDAAYAGSSTDSRFTIIAGTPTPGVTTVPTTAAAAATDGAGAVPVSSLVIAYILVPAAATSIVTADIAYVIATANPGFLGLWLPITAYTSGVGPASTSGLAGITGAKAPYDPGFRPNGDTVQMRGLACNGNVGTVTTIGTVPFQVIPAKNVALTCGGRDATGNLPTVPLLVGIGGAASANPGQITVEGSGGVALGPGSSVSFDSQSYQLN